MVEVAAVEVVVAAVAAVEVALAAVAAVAVALAAVTGNIHNILTKHCSPALCTCWQGSLFLANVTLG